MTESWLQRTVDVPNIIDDLIGQYTQRGIDKITSTDVYAGAQAAMAMALTTALDKTKLSRRKRHAVGMAMMDQLMTGAAVVFMLGYDQARRENSDAQ